MTNRNTFPLHDLVAYRVARGLLIAVQAARICNPALRDQALRAATAVALNIAEAVGRPSRADQRRIYGIAHSNSNSF